MIWLAALAALLLARLLWQRRPGLATCATFWGLAFVMIVLLGWTGALSGYVSFLGIVCNAAVTLANGGFMPVNARRLFRPGARSLWVERQSGQQLLFLADNFGTNFIRFSVGDVLLFSGVLLGAVGL